jgi:hypothetical protein
MAWWSDHRGEPVPGRRQAETYEHNHAFDVRGVVGLDIGGVRIRNVGGDFFYLAGGYMPGGSFRHSQDVRIHDIDAQGNGRMGVAMLDGLDGFEIWDNVMGGITWYSLDIENNGHIFSGVPAGVTNGKIHNNKFGPIPYGRNPQLAPLPGISTSRRASRSPSPGRHRAASSSRYRISTCPTTRTRTRRGRTSAGASTRRGRRM